MGERQERPRRVHRLEAAQAATRKPQLRRPELPDDLDVFPQNATRMARAQRLHRGFLRREASREARYRVAVAHTISNLLLRVHASEKAVAVALKRVADPRDVRRVEAQTDDVHL